MPRSSLRPARNRLIRLALLAAVALPTPVLAADDDPRTIIVTARRQDERFAEVPLAVDVVDRDAIGPGSVSSLQSLALRLPGLSFEAAWGGANSFPVLRGQSQPSGIISGDNVGMFVDGVYQASRSALDVVPLDLERIEVVHGPQSALFGHSSFAGLIHYVPALPTEDLLVKMSADAGTDAYYGLSGTISGPIDANFKGRLAASWRQADGTWENAAAPGQHLGNSRRFALAATVATRDDGGPFSLRLSGRYGDNRSNHPATFALDYRSYNCGGRDATSGAWSYFCGKPPISGQVAISPGLPDSRARTGQVALHLALDLGDVELRSDSSLYRAESDTIRDFDGSAEGDFYGVCIQGTTCNPGGGRTLPVVRLQRVNITTDNFTSVREIAQELRLRSIGDRRFAWQLGATIFWMRSHNTTGQGASRGNLAATERFASLVLSNPLQVGVPAPVNSALVDDPNTSQVLFTDNIMRRRTMAFFATAEYRIGEDLRLRGEVRSTWERLTLDSRIANFGPGFGTLLGTRHFHDLTPRFSLDWRPAQGWLAYASYAKGSRSGGFNANPAFLPEEQTFEPESNWTAEIGVKYAGTGLIRNVQVAVYDIDWRDTQIQSLSATPGVTAQPIRNTRGIRTQGIEATARLVPAGWLAFDLAWSYTNPRFKRGSEAPGDSDACGLSAANSRSSFCRIVPSAVNPGRLVPDISGNRVYRAVSDSWFAGVTFSPSLTALPGLRLQADVSYQGNVYERQVNGLFYGARTLLGARLTVPLGRFAIELWGTNLTDERYVRIATPRLAMYYLGVPRPTDFFLGDGRRIGLTVRYPR
ncbi:MAG TPA: TonB-dependent receptor [Novosphingobium sp.]|nr:TonB-dependent receptor [Novosphingobium sp.]